MDKFIENNYKLFKNGTSKRLLRHNFFSKIETEILAYLLGFIYADGSINDKRNNLTIHLSNKDIDTLNLFNIISPDAHRLIILPYETSTVCRGRHVKDNGSTRIDIASKILILDLHNLGVILNKTYANLHIPTQIPKNLIRHFMRGYFDGDGSVTISVRKPNKSNREINYRVAVKWEICSKTESILIDFLKILSEEDIIAHINYIKRDDMYRLVVSSKLSFINTYNYFYNESLYFMHRKFDKFYYYVNTEVSQIITDHRNALEVSVNESNNLPKSSEQDLNDLIENSYWDYLNT